MSNERSKEWVLGRVRKLLTLGNDPGAEAGERDNAIRMAHRLLAKYNLEIAEAEAIGQPVDEKRTILSGEFYGRPWARVIAGSAAKLLFCDYIYSSARKAKNTRHYFIGRESNAISAREMAAYLVASVAREGRRKTREINGGNFYFRSFATSAAVAIDRRVSEILEAQRAKPNATPGTALVLSNYFETEATDNRELRDQSFKTKASRSGSRSFSYQGAIDGKRYGDSISLNLQVGQSTPLTRLRKQE